MKSDVFSKVENATVTLTKKGGQGILIKNQMILTACHCIDFSITGEMALGDYFCETIKTPKGYLITSPMCLEPITDIAILEGPDSQEFYDKAVLFEEFCKNTKPVKISRDKLEPNKQFKIFIFTHEKKWIEGTAELCFLSSPLLLIKADEAIKGGTSGSGIINEKGEIVGIVSTATEENYSGTAPRPLLALPVWVCRKINAPSSF